jgi:hypothetical protein
MPHILEWRWSDETNWRYDSHIQDSFNNPQQLADSRNASAQPIPGGKAYPVWRIRKISQEKP